MSRIMIAVTAVAVLGACLLALWPVGEADAQTCKTRSRCTSCKKIKLLILSGANNHKWKETTPALKKMYADSGRFAVTVTEDVPELRPADFAKYDCIVSNYTTYPKVTGRRWPAETEKAFLAFVKNGGGFVHFHAASTAWMDWPEFMHLGCVSWRKDEKGRNISGHGKRHAFEVKMTDAEHPVTAGLKDFTHAVDELFHRQKVQKGATVLATAFSAKEQRGSGEEEPMIVVREYGKGRVMYNAMGHDTTAMQCKGFQALMLRGAEWAATGKVTIAAPKE